MTVKAISSSSPDPNKTAEDLNKFAKANEKQLYKLLKTLLDPQTDLKTLIKNHVSRLCILRAHEPLLIRVTCPRAEGGSSSH